MESKGIYFTPVTVRRKIVDNVYICVYIVYTNTVNRNKRR